jgi:hypothetical protein
VKAELLVGGTKSRAIKEFISTLTFQLLSQIDLASAIKELRMQQFSSQKQPRLH